MWCQSRLSLFSSFRVRNLFSGTDFAADRNDTQTRSNYERVMRGRKVKRVKHRASFHQRSSISRAQKVNKYVCYKWEKIVWFRLKTGINPEMPILYAKRITYWNITLIIRFCAVVVDLLLVYPRNNKHKADRVELDLLPVWASNVLRLLFGIQFRAAHTALKCSVNYTKSGSIFLYTCAIEAVAIRNALIECFSCEWVLSRSWLCIRNRLIAPAFSF
jgi:hypothetical protein